MNISVASSAAEHLRKQIQELLHTHCQCADGQFRGCSVTFNETNAVIAFRCGRRPEPDVVSMSLERLQILRCPFCDGPLLLAGESWFKPGQFSIGRMCYRCHAYVRQYSGQDAVVPSEGWARLNPFTACCSSPSRAETSIHSGCCSTTPEPTTC